MSYRNNIPTIGVLAGWQFYRTATHLSHLAPLSEAPAGRRGILAVTCCSAVEWGPPSLTDLMMPAWPVHSPEADFVPVGPWNTDGLIIANPLHSPTRSAYIQQLRAQ